MIIKPVDPEVNRLGITLWCKVLGLLQKGDRSLRYIRKTARYNPVQNVFNIGHGLLTDDISINGGKSKPDQANYGRINCRFDLIQPVFGFRKTGRGQFEMDHGAKDTRTNRICSSFQVVMSWGRGQNSAFG